MSQVGWSLASIILGLGLVTAAPSNPSEGLDDLAQAIVDDAWQSGGWESGAVYVSIGEEELFSAAFGVEPKDADEGATPVTPFRAAPMAHTFLATLVLQRCANGDLSLDDELGKHLPKLVGEHSEVRVRNLLNHTSGFADCGDLEDYSTLEAGPAWEYLYSVTKQPLITHPGECVAHTATDTLLVAALLEKLDGKHPGEWLQVALFDVSGMDASSYRVGDDDARPTDAASDGEELRPQPFDLTRVYSSARDLARFQRSLVDFEFFGAADLRLMTSPTRLNDGRMSPHGMGMRQISIAGSRGAIAGGLDAHGAVKLAYFPEHDLTVTVIGRGEDLDVDRLTNALAALVIDAPEPALADRLLKPDAAEVFVGAYQIGCDTLYITFDEGRLVLDNSIAGTFVLLNQGDHRFVARADHGIVLQFDVRGDRAKSFMLDDHGVQSVATRFQDGGAER